MAVLSSKRNKGFAIGIGSPNLATNVPASGNGLHLGNQYTNLTTGDIWDLNALPGSILGSGATGVGNRGRWEWLLCCAGGGTTGP